MQPLSTMHALVVDDFQTATFRTKVHWLSLLPLKLIYWPKNRPPLVCVKWLPYLGVFDCMGRTGRSGECTR